MIIRTWFVVLLLLPMASFAARPELAIRTAAADELALGRVFMTPLERETLDKLRKQKPVETIVTTTDQAVAPAVVKGPIGAGYIMPSDGTAYEWSDGDFRRKERGDIDTARFPGDILILRQPAGSRKLKPGADVKPEETLAEDRASDVDP